MNIGEKAIKYLIRKKNKTIILLFVLLVVETMILSSVTVLRAARDTQEILQEKTRTKLIMDVAHENVLFSDQDIEPLRNNNQIKSVNRMARAQTLPCKFSVFTESSDISEVNKMVQVVSYDELEMDGPFSDRQAHLIEGSYPESNKEVVVNQAIARLNHWEVGQQILFESKRGQPVEAKISGIYISGLEAKQSENILAVYRIENTMYSLPKFAAQLQSIEGYESVSFYLKSPEQADEIAEKIKVTIGAKAEISKSDALYQELKQPLEQAVRVVTLMLALTIGTAVIVISLLLSMWMRARKKEVAIFISLGIKKISVLLQMLLESLVVFAVSTSLSLISGNIIAKVLVRILTLESEKMPEVLNVGIQIMDIFWLTTIGMGILVLAICVSSLPILCANPKSTLSEMEG